MFFVHCDAVGCEDVIDGYSVIDEESKTWFRTPPGDPNRKSGWLCLAHKPSLDTIAIGGVVAAPPPMLGNTWVGESLPDPEVLAEIAANMTDEQKMRFVSAAQPEVGRVLPFVNNMMRPRSKWSYGNGKPKFERLPDPDEYPEVATALDIVADDPESDPKFKAIIDKVWKTIDASLDKDEQLQKDFGFTEPEDGVEARYEKHKAKVPWVRNKAWWILHNSVAHPLIGVLPVRWAFRFHDWTSRRMHGLK